MPYTLNFSDPTKSDTIYVPDMPPGINTVDTSLNLVGKGYPNYGEKTAENFLHLLENFSSPYPGPNNPIEGQLWYDTTDPNHKVLRVRDGINWSNVSGIYQQSDDPRTSAEAPARLRAGDIWVDTTNYQLKIFNNNNWTLVGPMVTSGSTTGLSVDTLYSTTETPGFTQGHPVIKLWAEGDIVAVVTSRAFTPRSVIPGFTDLKPGINLRATAFGTTIPAPILNGTAKTAQNLEINGVRVSSGDVLRKEDSVFRSQVITGQVFFKTPTELIDDAGFGQSKYGVVINNESSTLDSKYIQFYKGEHDAIILNNDPAGKIVLKVNDGTSTLVSAVNVDATGVEVNVPLTVNGTLNLQSSTYITGDLSVSNNITVGNTLSVAGSTEVDGNLTVNGQITVTTTTAIVPSVSGVYSIGTQSNYFHRVFVNYIGTSTSETVVYGKVKGSATSLEYGTTFKIKGHVEADSSVFSGEPQNLDIAYVGRLTNVATIQTPSPHNLITGTYITVECSDSTFDATDVLISSTTETSITYYNLGDDIDLTAASGTIYATPLTFNSTLTSAAISSQPDIAFTSSDDLNFLVLNSSTNVLGKITYPVMIGQVMTPGMMMVYGAGSPPAGWLLCDGSTYSVSTYPTLYGVIGITYGSGGAGTFKLPDFTGAIDMQGNPIYYIIKT